MARHRRCCGSSRTSGFPLLSPRSCRRFTQPRRQMLIAAIERFDAAFRERKRELGRSRFLGSGRSSGPAVADGRARPRRCARPVRSHPHGRVSGYERRPIRARRPAAPAGPVLRRRRHQPGHLRFPARRSGSIPPLSRRRGTRRRAAGELAQPSGHPASRADDSGRRERDRTASTDRRPLIHRGRRAGRRGHPVPAHGPRGPMGRAANRGIAAHAAELFRLSPCCFEAPRRCHSSPRRSKRSECHLW